MGRGADGVARRLDLRHVGVTNLHGERQTVRHRLLGWWVDMLPVGLAHLWWTRRHIAGRHSGGDEQAHRRSFKGEQCHVGNSDVDALLGAQVAD